MLDDVDKVILKILQQNARTPNAEIARRVGIVPSAIFERIRKMEERGIIEGYGVRLKPEALGFGLLAFILVRTKDVPYDTSTASLLAKIPEVLEVHTVASEDCYLLKLRTGGTQALMSLMKTRFSEIKTIVSTRSIITLETEKETAALPICLDTEADSE